MSRFPIASFAVSKLFRGRNQGTDLLVGREKELNALDAAWSGAEKKSVVTIVAWGGVGKTSLVARWAAETMAKENHGGIERYFDWSFYSQGTRAEGDATGADKAASADIFVKEALEFFGDPDLAASNAGAWQKGEHLAQLVSEHRVLLILDGLEPLQDAKSGELRDEALRALLRGLAADNRGLCLITTRQKLPELNTYHTTTAPEWKLEKLSTKAGAALLAKLGVTGSREEREQLSEDVKGHALTLTLLGKYLAEAHSGDIRQRDLVSLTEADYEETSGHAFQVMEAYEKWLGTNDRLVELSILRLLGLFERPATPDCLAALRRSPAIPDLTETLTSLTDVHWNLAVKRLVQLGLLEEQPWAARRIVGYTEEDANRFWEAAEQNRVLSLGSPKVMENQVLAIQDPRSLDAHPLVREYFGRRLRAASKTAWKAAHSRLFEHLTSWVPFWPEGLDGLQPLYQAVVHGCQAGRHQEACAKVYRDRILRITIGPQANYSTFKLGAIGADLSAIGCFFSTPWTRPASELADEDQAWLLNEAAFSLRAVGRLAEAQEPMRAAIDAAIRQEKWKSASLRSSNLTELYLTLGDVASAMHLAKQSVIFADRSGDIFPRMAVRTTLADALNEAGMSEEALAQFEEAEALQQQRQPEYPLLHALPGFRYCELLSTDCERAAWNVLLQCVLSEEFVDWDSLPIIRNGNLEPTRSELMRSVEERAVRTLEWVRRQKAPLLSIALNELTLSRARVYRAVAERSARIQESALRSCLDVAVNGLRRSGQLDYVVRGLLTRAVLLAVRAQTVEARADLDEAQQIAERGPMPLNLADIHLYRARLFFSDDFEAAREDLQQARTLIEKCGYLRRMPELEDAEKVIFAGK